MVALEVSVNGKRRYVAGHADARMVNISVGDEVTIRIIEVDHADLPTERSTGDGSVEIVADVG
jgi:hypothetical protein